MDGLIKGAQRGREVDASLPPSFAFFAGSLFSAVICQQALENKRGRQGMRRGIIRFAFTLIEPGRKDIKVGMHHGKSSQSHNRGQSNENQETPPPPPFTFITTEYM